MGWPVGRARSAETRAKISRSMSTPSWLAGHRQRLAKWYDIPANRKAHIEMIHRTHRTEAFRNRISVTHLGMKLSPASKRKQSDSMKKRWRDPLFRVLRAATMSRPDVLEKCRSGPKAYMATKTPEERRAWMMRAAVALQRKRRTRIELLMQHRLASAGIPFVEQHPIDRCIPDFLVLPNLVVECDGEYWHSLPGRIKKDRKRDYWLRSKGYRVIRIPERDITRGLYQQLDARLLTYLQV